MSKIFISHGPETGNLADLFAQVLRNIGHEVNLVNEMPTAAGFIRERIAELISQCDVFVVFLDDDGSKSGAVNYELGLALGLHQDRGRPALLPVVMGDPSNLPAALLGIQYYVPKQTDQKELLRELALEVEMLFVKQEARREKREKAKQRIESTAEDYIQESMRKLELRESRNKRVAIVWYLTSVAALIGALAIVVWRGFFFDSDQMTWQEIANLSLVVIVIVGLLSAVARLSFMLGKSFMVESLRSADRIHAISFGEFYLKAYGDEADRKEIKEAFQDWNIDKGSSFIDQNVSDVDPHLVLQLAKLLNLIKAAQ